MRVLSLNQRCVRTLLTTLAIAIAFALSPGNASAQEDQKTFPNIKRWYETYQSLTETLHVRCEDSLKGVQSAVYSRQCAEFVGAAEIFFYFTEGIGSGYGVDATPEDVLGISASQVKVHEQTVRDKLARLLDGYARYRGDFPVASGPSS